VAEEYLAGEEQLPDEELPMDTSRDVFYFTDGALAYAGHHYHDGLNPVHSHSFVEIAFVMAGSATHLSLGGRQRLTAGDAVLLRPGVWHGYDDCDHLHLVNCCFSGELLRRELAWTRQDLLLGYLLWTGPYSARGRGMLSTRLDPEAFEECKVHLAALDALRNQPVAQHRGDIVGRLALLFSHLGRAVEQSHQPFLGPAGPAHPAIGRAMRLLEERLAYRWTLTELADQLHLAPGYLVRLFKATTGLPPMAYLARLRAEHAATLLLHSDQPVTCIGQAVGWPDQNYFARRFRAHYGLSATTYRARFATGAIHLAPNPGGQTTLSFEAGSSEAGSSGAGSSGAGSFEAS
jgi:AraC family transcriptional regulator, L-rhamnose operon transcriptional activator RhaR